MYAEPVITSGLGPPRIAWSIGLDWVFTKISCFLLHSRNMEPENGDRKRFLLETTIFRVHVYSLSNPIGPCLERASINTTGPEVPRMKHNGMMLALMNSLNQ